MFVVLSDPVESINGQELPLIHQNGLDSIHGGQCTSDWADDLIFDHILPHDTEADHQK